MNVLQQLRIQGLIIRLGGLIGRVEWTHHFMINRPFYPALLEDTKGFYWWKNYSESAQVEIFFYIWGMCPLHYSSLVKSQEAQT